MSQIVQASVSSSRVNGEVIWCATARMNKKAIFRTDELATEQQARLEVSEWAERMGKDIQWDTGLITRRSQVGDSVTLETTAGEQPLSRILNREESSLMHDCERTIEKGLDTFLEVGQALIVVRERRLYRERFGTFAEYCIKRWAMSGRRAHQLCAAADVVENLQGAISDGGKQNGHLLGNGSKVNNCSPAEAPPVPPPLVPAKIVPTNESQARVLAPLSREKQHEVWNLAVEKAEGKQPTAEQVWKARKELVGERKEEPALNLVSESAMEEPPTEAKRQILQSYLRTAGGELCALEFRLLTLHDKGGAAHVVNAMRALSPLLEKYEVSNQRIKEAAQEGKAEQVQRRNKVKGSVEFVLCREPSKGAVGVAKKPRYAGFRGGWTPDPSRITPFASVHQAREKAHPHDKVMPLAVALKRFKQSAKSKS